MLCEWRSPGNHSQSRRANFFAVTLQATRRLLCARNGNKTARQKNENEINISERNWAEYAPLIRAHDPTKYGKVVCVYAKCNEMKTKCINKNKHHKNKYKQKHNDNQKTTFLLFVRKSVRN